MKVLANVEGLGVRGTIHTTDLAKDTLVKISGDNTFDAAGASDIVVGHISVPSKTGADNPGTVETKYKKRFSAKCSGAIAAGTEVKAAAPSSGASVMTDLSSSSRALVVGICIVGAADGAVGEFLGY